MYKLNTKFINAFCINQLALPTAGYNCADSVLGKSKLLENCSLAVIMNIQVTFHLGCGTIDYSHYKCTVLKESYLILVISGYFRLIY